MSQVEDRINAVMDQLVKEGYFERRKSERKDAWEYRLTEKGRAHARDTLRRMA